jgi:hypothetical protein
VCVWLPGMPGAEQAGDEGGSGGGGNVGAGNGEMQIAERRAWHMHGGIECWCDCGYTFGMKLLVGLFCG